MLISAALTTVTTIYTAQQQKKAASKRAREAAAARDRAEKLQKRRDDVQASRQKRRAVAEARRFRAQSVNLAANRGAGGAVGAQGSTLQGVQGNIQSQLNYNNAFINQVTGLNQGIRSAFNEAQTIANRPLGGSGIASALGAASSAFGAFAGSKTGGDWLKNTGFFT